jgi:mono/diheme cytochrome c family protein
MGAQQGMHLKIGLIGLIVTVAAGAAASATPVIVKQRLPGEPPAGAAPAAMVEHGNKAFQYYCAPCHGTFEKNLPGTTALAVKYKGARPGALEARDDLTSDFVIYTVRHGIKGMPQFRKVELSDANLAAIGAYLAKSK